MAKEFRQIEWDAVVEDDCRQIVRLAVREDLERLFDWTTVCLVPSEAEGRAAVVRGRRRCGGLAGGETGAGGDGPARRVVAAGGRRLGRRRRDSDRNDFRSGARLLTTERIVLNVLGRLSGVATLTRRYVNAVTHTRAQIYDTRKTTPGWRRLEKYAVRAGGGHNHRTGLFDGILIKDNHLALAASAAEPITPAEAVRQARRFVEAMAAERQAESMLVEVEVDTLEQLRDVLPTVPDVVLLDNFGLERWRSGGTAQRGRAGGRVGSVGRRESANRGGDRRNGGRADQRGRLRAGSAPALDVGLDWL